MFAAQLLSVRGSFDLKHKGRLIGAGPQGSRDIGRGPTPWPTLPLPLRLEGLIRAKNSGSRLPLAEVLQLALSTDLFPAPGLFLRCSLAAKLLRQARYERELPGLAPGLGLGFERF